MSALLIFKSYNNYVKQSTILINMYIDTHVHLRDCYQEKKETIKHGLEVARDSGLDAIFEGVPGTKDRITIQISVAIACFYDIICTMY